MLQRKAATKGKHSLRLAWRAAAWLAERVTHTRTPQTTALNHPVPTVNSLYRDPKDPRVQVAQGKL